MTRKQLVEVHTSMLRGTPLRCVGHAFMLATLCTTMTACISASAPKTSAQMNGEAMYTTQPWADTKPVNITDRLNAVQGVVAAMQSAQTSYYDFKITQANAFNERAFLRAEIARHDAELRRRLEQAEAARIKAGAEQPRSPIKGVKAKPVAGTVATFSDYAWEIGTSIIGHAKSVRGWMAEGHPTYP